MKPPRERESIDAIVAEMDPAMQVMFEAAVRVYVMNGCDAQGVAALCYNLADTFAESETAQPKRAALRLVTPPG